MKPRAKSTSFTSDMFVRQYRPALISALVFSVADMADALVVGNRMGTLGLAAIAFSLPVYMFFNLIMHSFGLGGSIIFSKYMAKGEEKEARSSFQGVLTTLLITGVAVALLGNIFLDNILILLGASKSNPELFHAAGVYLRCIITATPLFFFSYSVAYYLRNDDLEKVASICSTIGSISDFSLNILLVLILDMGVLGAGLATAVGVTLTSIIQFFFIQRKKKHIGFSEYAPNFKDLAASFKLGASSNISSIYSFICLWLGNNAMMRLAGEDGVAIFDVMQNMTYLVIYIYGAISMASQPIISTYEGECNYKECDRLQAFVKGLTTVNAIILILIFNLSPPFILRLFGITAASSVAYGSFALRVYSLCVIFVGLNIAIANYYTSRNISFPPFLLATLRGMAILIPTMIICIFFGKYTFWFTYPITEALSLLVISIYLKFFRKHSKRIDKARIYTASLGSDISELGKSVEEIEAFCEKWECTPKQMYYVQMTVEEMCSAIINHGFKKMPGHIGRIQLTLVALDDKAFSLHIRDNAFTFNPFDMDQKALDELADEDSDFNALGMEVIKNKAAAFYYRRYQGFNTMVVMI